MPEKYGDADVLRAYLLSQTGVDPNQPQSPGLRDSLGEFVQSATAQLPPGTPLGQALAALLANPMTGLRAEKSFPMGPFAGQIRATQPWAGAPDIDASVSRSTADSDLTVEGGKNPYQGWHGGISGRLRWGR